MRHAILWGAPLTMIAVLLLTTLDAPSQIVGSKGGGSGGAPSSSSQANASK